MLPAALLPPHLPLVGPLVSEGCPMLPAEPHLTPVCFSLCPQPTHELRLPALQFQDAEHRVPEPASQHIHRGFWHSHLRLHPQSALLLLLDQVRKCSLVLSRAATVQNESVTDPSIPKRGRCYLTFLPCVSCQPDVTPIVV